MRSNEIITVYLAIGASFGVDCFLRQRTTVGYARALARSASATLLWPIAASQLLLTRQHITRDEQDRQSRDARRERNVERLEDEILAVLHSIEDAVPPQHISSESGRMLQLVLCIVREGIELYAGLAPAALEAKLDAVPSPRELAVCQIAGRKGNDLQIGGRCIHRRNIIRLHQHRDAARTNLLAAFAALSQAADGACLASPINIDASRRLAAMVLATYGYTVELFSVLDDMPAAMTTATHLDAACARVRQLETIGLGDASDCAVNNGQSPSSNQMLTPVA